MNVKKLNWWLNSVGYTFSTEYQAVLDYAAADPSNRGTPPSLLIHRIQEDVGVRFLVSSGIWATADQAALLNTFGDEKWSLINIKTPGTRNLSKIGNPTFTPGWGWLTSTNNALSTNYAPATHGINYTQNIGGYVYFSGSEKVGTNGLEFAGAAGAANANGISNSLRNASNQLVQRINHATAVTTGNQRYTSGLYHVRRTASNAFETWINGIQRVIGTQASTGLTSQTITLGGFNSNGTNLAFDNKYIGFWMIGNGWAGLEEDIWEAWVALNTKDIETTTFPDWTDTSGDLTPYLTALGGLNDKFTDVIGTYPVLHQKALSGSDATGYQGVCAAKDSTGRIKIYGGPSTALNFLKIDPDTDTYSTIGLLQTLDQKSISMTCAPNGMIYCAPYYSPNVIKLNPITNTVTHFDTTGPVAVNGGNLVGDRKWAWIGVGGNGLLYCLPYDATEIMVIDTSNDSIYFIDTTGVVTFGNGNLTDLAKCDGGTPYGDFIYGTPSTVTYFIKIDTSNDTVTTFGTLAAGVNKYFPATLGRNDRIYFYSYGAANILKLNPSNDTVSTFGTLTATGAWKTGGSFVLPDGRIFACNGTDRFGVLHDPDDDTIIEIGLVPTTTQSPIGVKLATNGAAYTIPWSGTKVLKIYAPSMNITMDDNFILSRYNNHY